MAAAKISPGAAGLPDVDELATVGGQEAKTHLLVMMNGIVGSAANWAVVQDNFNQHTSSCELALLASKANSKLQVRYAKACVPCLDILPVQDELRVAGSAMI